MTHTQNGLGALWIVTKASPNSELGDILFQSTPREFALQVRGGLDPDEILGWFEDHSEANQIALQELFHAKKTATQTRTSVVDMPYGRATVTELSGDAARWDKTNDELERESGRSFRRRSVKR